MNPSSVPSWNERRFSALASISPQNRTLIISTPADFTRYIVGLASLLGETNIWAYEQGALSATQIADEYNDRTSYMYDFCELVADCIANDQRVRDALGAYLQKRSVPTGTSDSVPASNTSLIDGSCDDDKLYGAIVEIVEFLNLVAKDFLERVANDTAWGSALLRAVDAIPMLGDLPVLDDLADYVEWVTDSGLSAYESGYTVVLAEDIACNIFCASRTGCDLTPTKILQGIADESALSLAVNDPIELILRAATLSVGDTDFALGVLYTITALLAAGGDVLGFVGLPSLEQLANNAPDDTGHTACSCPNCDEFDFLVSDGGWVSRSGAPVTSVWQSGVGWVGGNYTTGGGDPVSAAQLTYDIAQAPTSFEARAYIEGDGGTARQTLLALYYDDQGVFLGSTSVPVTSAQTYTLDDQSIPSATRRIRLDAQADGNNKDVFIEYAQICY